MLSLQLKLYSFVWRSSWRYICGVITPFKSFLKVLWLKQLIKHLLELGSDWRLIIKIVYIFLLGSLKKVMTWLAVKLASVIVTLHSKVCGLWFLWISLKLSGDIVIVDTWELEVGSKVPFDKVIPESQYRWGVHRNICSSRMSDNVQLIVWLYVVYKLCLRGLIDKPEIRCIQSSLFLTFGLSVFGLRLSPSIRIWTTEISIYEHMISCDSIW